MVPCGCNVLGMGGEKARPMWSVVVLLLFVGQIQAICPARCKCNEDSLRVSCASGSLEVVPIQLNPEVRHIDLADNRISNVLFTFNFYSNLVSLDLSGNKIQSLGSMNFESQRNLKHLNLSGNEIETLWKDSLKGLCALAELDLSLNRLEKISVHAFRDLHSLEVLKLNGNQIVYLEESLFKSSTMLRVLLLENNQLLEIPTGAISDATNLNKLSLTNNLIVTVAEGEIPNLPLLESLQLNNNLIRDIHAGALSGLTSLEFLDLSDNNFTAVPTVSLAKLSNLTKLKFSGNFINYIPPVAFKGLFQLRFLRLDRLEFLSRIDPRAFVDNINLEKIWLDDNIAVETLPGRLFYGNPRITHISIRNNQLATLDASHFPLDQLKWLKLGRNPLECNCSLLWLWRLEQEQKARSNENETAISEELFVDIDEISCAGPEPLDGVLLADATESQVGCSLGWIAALSAVALTCFMLAIAVILLYCGPLKKHVKRNESPPSEAAQCPNGPALTLTYEDPRADKYIIGPPLIHEYRTLAPWDPYSKDCSDVYRQFDSAPKARPHIVYV
ncbi:PREDICTED: chondroadherin-like [Nicrophorus vespilloides]|uniref:Chondroadherin-like n=1 Tax=Nicrophorus vespilloides TaxID=110193 RepID=A0ABM1N0A0_NICVS|nr:PREDICTED: chondroadherin-like [Nicrophorus vespilloides]